MMNIAALTQVKAFARQDGVFLALLWTAGFLTMVLVPASSGGSLITLSTPFFVGWLLSRFRNYALGGNISFLRALAYSGYTFFYASLLFALIQYVYLRYFDHGTMMAMLTNSMKLMEETQKGSGAGHAETLAQLRQGLEMVGMMSPIQLSFIFMMQNIFVGTLLSFPIALFCKKNTHTNRL